MQLFKQTHWYFIYFLAFPAIAQEVDITHVELQGSDVIIHYNLQDEDLNRRYSLHLYNSIDNYIQPIEKVSGDIGVDIAVGDNKKVVWHAMEELGEDFDAVLFGRKPANQLT